MRDSGVVEFSPLTVFIGNNGSGKSSLIESLETFQNIVLHGLDEAFLPWRGFEHVWNQAVSHQLKEDQIGKLERQNPMVFEVEGRWKDVSYRGAVEIGTDLKDGNQIVFTREDLIPQLSNQLKNYKKPDRHIKHPKSELISLFQHELGRTRKYIDRNHALLLAQAIPDWSRLCRSSSFRRVAEKAARVKV